MKKSAQKCKITVYNEVRYFLYYLHVIGLCTDFRDQFY